MELFKRRNNLNNEQLSSVMHSFGITGNGNEGFFNEMEETITDSPVFIESHHLTKILTGYAEVDRGSPAFYSIIVEKLIDRGIENIEVVEITKIARSLSKATNVQKGGYGFYKQMEKHIKTELHEGRVSFD